jgi:hypothetical protein
VPPQKSRGVIRLKTRDRPAYFRSGHQALYLENARLRSVDGARKPIPGILTWSQSGRAFWLLSGRAGLARSPKVRKGKTQVFSAKHVETRIPLMQLMFFSHRVGKFAGYRRPHQGFNCFRMYRLFLIPAVKSLRTLITNGYHSFFVHDYLVQSSLLASFPFVIAEQRRCKDATLLSIVLWAF